MSSLMRSLTSSLQGTVMGATIKSSSLAIVIGTDERMLTASAMLATVLDKAQVVAVKQDTSSSQLLQEVREVLKTAQTAIIAIHADQIDLLKGLKAQLIAVRSCDNARQGAAIEKLLAKRPRFIVLNHDDPYFNQFDQHPPAEQSMTFGTHLDADCRLTQAYLSRQLSRLELLVDRHTELSLITQLQGKEKVYDTLLALAAAYVLHIPSAEIVETLAGFREDDV